LQSFEVGPWNSLDPCRVSRMQRAPRAPRAPPMLFNATAEAWFSSPQKIE